ERGHARGHPLVHGETTADVQGAVRTDLREPSDAALVDDALTWRVVMASPLSRWTRSSAAGIAAEGGAGTLGSAPGGPTHETVGARCSRSRCRSGLRRRLADVRPRHSAIALQR